MSTRDRDRAILQAAQLYYFDGLTQAAVADRLGCTRWTVSRLLQEGVERGIIHTSVRHPHARLRSLEEQLAEKYGLRDVRVVPTLGTRAETFVLVARTAAEYLGNFRPRPKRVAVGWGKTTAALARAMRQGWSPEVQVAQANVAPAEVGDLLARGPVRILASRGPGEAYFLEGTPMAPSGALMRDGFTLEPNREALEIASNADVIVFSPGSVGESSILVRAGSITPRMLDQLIKSGAQANVLCRFVDGRGEPVSESLNERTMAVELGELRGDRVSMAVSYGIEKTPALRAVLRGGLANVAVLDEEVSRELLAAD